MLVFLIVYICAGQKDLLGKKDFKKALYMLDIGQNDLLAAFLNSVPYDQLIESIPSFISEIKNAMWVSTHELRTK